MKPKKESALIFRTMFKSKIHRATVTDANLDYEGSITVDALLMQKADLFENEKVSIYNVTNGKRFCTYVIPGPKGKGDICLNGAAAHKAKRGDLIIIASYAVMEEDRAREHRPTVIRVDRQNRLLKNQAPESSARNHKKTNDPKPSTNLAFFVESQN